MARCGCTDEETNRNVMRGGCGIAVSGAGTTTSPRRLDLVGDSCLCAVVRDCVTDKVCGGLSYEDGCLGVNVSHDTGNRLRIADDGGVYADCIGSAAACVADVSALPAFIAGGMWGAGLNVDDLSVRSSFAQAASLGLHLTICKTYRLCDGSFFTGPNVNLTDAKYSNSLGALTGTVTELTVNQAVAVNITSDVAYGKCQVQDGLDPLSGILKETRHRVPLSVELPTGTATASTTTDTELLDLLTRCCAQGRALVHVDGTATDAERAKLATFRTAGYETGVYINDATAAALHTPAKLQAEGIHWAYIHKNVPDATITPYVTAGINVLLSRVLLRTETARAQTLGLRGVLSEDPVYALGAPCSMSSDSWCSPALPSGQVGAHSVMFDSYRNARGLKTADGCGWEMPVGGSLPMVTDAVLLGWASFVQAPPPDTYTLTWQMRVTDVTTRKDTELGLIICAPDDSLPIASAKTTPAHTQNPGLTSGYVLRATVGSATQVGTITITKITKGAAPGPSSTATNTVRMTSNTWMKFSATVSPTQVTFSAYSSTTATTPTWTTTLADTTHRGGYIWTHKWERADTGSLKAQTAFRNFVRT